MTVIALDGMGGDHAPGAVMQGALLAARLPDTEIICCGQVSVLRALAPDAPANLRFLDAPESVGMAEAAAASIRQKPRSSIMVGLGLVRRGEADAFLSFGNTGAIMAASLVTLGRVPGVHRPALGAIFRNGRGARTVLLDIGANADCRPVYLQQFATMGRAYVERVLHHRNPSVGLLNVGEEEGKGSLLAQEAFALLKRYEPGFIGNVEGKDLLAGVADVVVTDGFTGNVTVKISEESTAMMKRDLQRALASRWRYRLAARLARGVFASLGARADYQQIGGAPLFGVNGAVIIGHGRADAEAVAAGIRLAREVGRSGYVEAIREAFREEAGRLAAEPPAAGPGPAPAPVAEPARRD